MPFVVSSPFSRFPGELTLMHRYVTYPSLAIPPSELDLARIFTAGGGLPLVEVLVRGLANWGGESWGNLAQIFSAAVARSGSGGACKTLEGVLNYPREQAEVAQLVEHHLAMVRVAGSNPVFRSYPGAEGVGELAAWPSG
jgi:hypothetical protein